MFIAFVGRYPAVALNFLVIPVVLFPFRGDELARVVYAECHIGDWQSLFDVVGFVECAD